MSFKLPWSKIWKLQTKWCNKQSYHPSWRKQQNNLIKIIETELKGTKK